MTNSRPHIGIFGRRNSGKSSLINLLTAQNVAIVSDTPGTTTDPVKKSVEIFGIGPAIIVDTAGIDDIGALGQKRIQKSIEAIKKVDCAILLIAGNQFGVYEIDLIRQFEKLDTPYLIVHNKKDIAKIASHTKTVIKQYSNAQVIDFSAKNAKKTDKLIEAIKKIIPENVYQKTSLMGDLVKPKDVVLLITPIDSEAPEGRMILPQNQAIRDALDNNSITVVVKETELGDFLALGIKPALAVTDSQAFGYVSERIPESVPLTSFSILFARLKGDFDAYLQGTPHIAELKDGDNILILESCTHQVSCDDIGRVKIPKLLQKFTGKKLSFTFVSGLSEIGPPKSPQGGTYALVIQCGGCMVTRKQLLNRLKPFISERTPVTNYGMTLAYVNGIFERATAVFSPLEKGTGD
ncbi:MAG: [FeFe] hydrogenase H-cluster maturation GTPase HydF [Petrimonas sp.]|nr:[FeFe] hydrogenase H-cluster maturation GTPase HydF [Petrimonas sp.]